MEPAPLPMDRFSVRARAAVELGQQSENAMSFLDRKTGKSVDKQAVRGTAWPRDDARRGAICQIVVRDTGFRRGVVLWRSVGLLVGDIGDNKGGERLFLGQKLVLLSPNVLLCNIRVSFRLLQCRPNRLLLLRSSSCFLKQQWYEVMSDNTAVRGAGGDLCHLLLGVVFVSLSSCIVPNLRHPPAYACCFRRTWESPDCCVHCLLLSPCG